MGGILMNIYLPNDWYLEFEDYKKNEFRGNEGIYDNFTDEQFEAIKDYFRWRTRSRFKELVANTSLAAKPKKAEVLSQIMEGITDWVYDGCVDTGVFGASHCDLGHALRYEHYALSPSTGKVLVFGVNCASDFFGIEPERLKKINSVQEETLEEIKLIAFIMNAGKFGEYFKRYYGDLMDIINVLRPEINEVFGKQWNQQIANFLTVKLPLTPSMIRKIEYVRNGVYTQRVQERKRYGKIIELCNNDPKAVAIVRDGLGKELFIVKVIVAYLNTEFNKADEKELRKRQSLARLVVQFTSTYNMLSERGVSNFYKFINNAKEEVYYTKTANGERLATKGEIKNRIPQLVVKEQYFLPEHQVKMLNIFGWGIFGHEKMYKASGCEDADNDMDKIIKSAKLMAETLAWLNNEEELKEAMKNLRDNMEEREYPDSAPDEIDVDVSMEEIIPFIYHNCLDNTKNSYYDIALDIARRAMQYNNYSVSVKQAAILRKVYAELKFGKANTESNKFNDFGSTDKFEHPILSKIKVLQDNSEHPALKNHEFAFKVIDTIMKYKKVSEKQEAVIDKAYQALMSSLKKEEKANIIFVEDAIESETNNENDYNNNEEYNLDNIGEDKENEVFIDDITSIRRKRSIWKTDAHSIVHMYSISEISEALGRGVFKEDDGNKQQ